MCGELDVFHQVGFEDANLKTLPFALPLDQPSPNDDQKPCGHLASIPEIAM
jgi:hypothetical protein